MMERFEAFKRRMLTHPDMRHEPDRRLGRRAHRADRRDRRPGQPAPAPGRPGAVGASATGSRTTSRCAPRSTTGAAEAVGYVVRTYGGEIVSVISDTIERWDGREAAARIELHVGRDLQFIRINGTVVGALVGLVIHTLSELL